MRRRNWFFKVSFAPDDGTTGGGGVVTPPPAAPASPAPTSAPAASPTPTSPSASAPATQGTSSGAAGSGSSPAAAGALTPPGTPGDFQGIRDAARALGYDFGNNVADDHAALQQLILRANEHARLQAQVQQMQPLAQHGQTYLQHAPQFQAWLAQQQTAERQAQEQKANWWKAPEWKPEWSSFLTKDATGNIVAVQGAPPGIVDKYLTFVDHQRNTMQQLAIDPIGTLRPGIEQVAQQIAEKIVQERLGGAQGEQFARTFVAQNAQWLYQRDASGQTALGFDGQPVLSPDGQRFHELMGRAQQLGLPTGQARAEYAYTMLRAEGAIKQQTPAAQAAAAAANGAQLQQQFLQNAAGSRPNASGVTAPPTNPNTPPPTSPQGARMSTKQLADQMMRAMQANGLQPGQAVDLGR